MYLRDIPCQGKREQGEADKALAQYKSTNKPSAFSLEPVALGAGFSLNL
jgi:hypothetical protein